MSALVHFETLTPADLDHPVHVYLLPHEALWLEREVGRLLGKQQFIGDTLGEAMHEGAETNHDNAPAEAMVSESRVLVDGGSNNTHYKTYELKRYSLLEYPIQDSPIIVPGSLVTVRFAGDKDTEVCEIGGGLTLGRNGLGANDHERLTPQAYAHSTYKSEMGAALIGRQVGDEVSYVSPMDGSDIGLEIVDLDQDAFIRYYPLLEKLILEGDSKNWHHRNMLAALMARSLVTLIGSQPGQSQYAQIAEADNQEFLSATLEA